MSDFPKAVLKRKPLFSVVWIVPILAAVGLIYTIQSHYRKMGPEIKIEFAEAGNLVANKTVIKYLGVPVGKVTALSVNLDSATVVATARLDRTAQTLAREGTMFTTIKPQVGFGGIQGLTTIFSGVYLALNPGKAAAPPAKRFKGYPDVEPPLSEQPGLSVVLTSSHANSLTAGDPVIFRGVAVGTIGDAAISSDGREVRVYLKIDPRYERFVRENSVFWKAGGLRAKLGLFNSQVSIDSMEALLKGGVAFATPDKPGKKVASGHTFALRNDQPKDVESWSPAL
jgi:paraquat-inducible protein B